MDLRCATVNVGLSFFFFSPSLTKMKSKEDRIIFNRTPVVLRCLQRPRRLF